MRDLKSADVEPTQILSAVVHEVDPAALRDPRDYLPRFKKLIGDHCLDTFREITKTPIRTRQVVRELTSDNDKRLAYALAVAMLDRSHFVARNYLNDLAEYFAFPPQIYRKLLRDDEHHAVRNVVKQPSERRQFGRVMHSPVVRVMQAL